MRKKYIFKKDYATDEGIIRQGSELVLFRGLIYLNGGIILPAYQKFLLKILETPQLRKEYLLEEEIIENKI